MEQLQAQAEAQLAEQQAKITAKKPSGMLERAQQKIQLEESAKQTQQALASIAQSQNQMTLPNEMTFKSSTKEVEKNSPEAVIQSVAAVAQVAPKAAVALPEVTKPAPVKVAAAPAPVAKAAAAAPAKDQAVQVS